uniref:Transmembrane protein n=1 Tax=Meloidogyne floridensis TaxID=298350 RepID=A0A915P556_9BILA
MFLSTILSIFFFSISQLLSFIFCSSSSSSLRLISHKTNFGVAAVVAASSKQQQEEEEELMDEWAPYRMAFLLILVASSVALWASYKFEHPDDNEELQQRVIAYQPLRQNCNNQLVLSLEGGGGRGGGGQ